MPLPSIDFRGQEATVSMTELRSAPGDVIDRVRRGLTVYIEKNGRRIASIVPTEAEQDDMIIVRRDGSITGPKPLTAGINLGSNC